MNWLAINWIDRAIGAVAPGAGLRRARQRQIIAVLARAYEGAKLGRRTEGWVAAGTAPTPRSPRRSPGSATARAISSATTPTRPRR